MFVFRLSASERARTETSSRRTDRLLTRSAARLAPRRERRSSADGLISRERDTHTRRDEAIGSRRDADARRAVSRDEDFF